MPGVLFPDIEALLIGHLHATLLGRDEPHAANVAVRNKVPAVPPARLVVIRDDGGPHLGDVRGVARVGVQVWAEDDGTVSDLANLVSALVGAAENVGPIRRVTSSRPYTVTDPAGRPNEYFTAELVVRGVSI